MKEKIKKWLNNLKFKKNAVPDADRLVVSRF